MKFRAERTAFEDGIKWVQRTVGERVSFPAMAGIKLSLSGDTLTLTSTNGSVDSELQMPVQGERDGGVLVSGKLLTNIVHLLPKDAVVLELDGDTLLLRCGRANFELRTMVLGDFPPVAGPQEGSTSVMLSTDHLAELVRLVSGAASTEDARPVFTGVNFEASDGNITAVATDSYRLALRTIPWEGNGEMEALVSSKALAQVRAAAELISGDMKMILESNTATFEFPDRRLVTTLVEGKYPDYRALIPETFETTAKIDRQSLAEVVRRIAVVGDGDKAMTPLVLELAGDSMVLRADSSETGQAEESLPVELTGEPITIGFNPKFLKEGLDTMITKDVVFKFQTPMKPAILEQAPAEDEDPTVGEFIYLLMPVRV